MVGGNLADFVQQWEANSNHGYRLEMAVRGFLDFFSFSRATLFAYSSLNWMGESVVSMHKYRGVSVQPIREDVRNIPPVYSAISRGKVEYVTNAAEGDLFPRRYVNEYGLTDLVIVPILHFHTVVGCVIADQYEGSSSIDDEDFYEMLLSYGKMIGRSIHQGGSVKKQKILSKRELEVLERMSRGYSIKEMADRMGISEYTVREYISSALRKLGVQHRAQAVAEAMRMGLIS